MDHGELLADAFGRIHEVVHEVVEGLSPEALSYRPDADANSIAWLVWHLTRIEDDHIADVAGVEQVWTSQGWADAFALDERATGYADTSEDVAAVQAASEQLLGYYDAVHAQTLRFVTTCTADDLDRIVDRRWTPPVTLGVRLVSVIADALQHAGQAAYVLGLYERR